MNDKNLIQTSREKKQKEQEKINSNIDKLHILFEYVRKTDNADRYIVSDNTDWGVVSGDGEIIIPMAYSKITMSAKKYFRVYGEVFGSSMMGFFMLKKQGLFDINGNEVIPIDNYSKVVLVGKLGLVYGSERDQSENVGIKYASYDSTVIHFSDKVHSVNILDKIPGILVLVYNTNSSMEKALIKIIRLDRLESGKIYDSEDKIALDPKDVWDDIKEFNESEDEDSEEALKKIKRKRNKIIDSIDIKYLVTLNGKQYYAGDGYVPLNYDMDELDEKKRASKIKSVYNMNPN